MSHLWRGLDGSHPHPKAHHSRQQDRDMAFQTGEVIERMAGEALEFCQEVRSARNASSTNGTT